MADPFPPPQQAGAQGQPFPGQPAYSEPYPDDRFAPPGAQPTPYPGMLPPAVSYPSAKPRRRTALWLSLLALVVVAAVVAAVLVIRTDRPGATGGAFTDASTKSTIQNYLTALSNGDTETIARNTSCGMFDAVKDKRADQALARLASDAFRRQFARAEVISIDKIVPWSSYQAQVLFTMKVAPTSAARNGRDEEQGVAQILRQDNQLLVCSYLLRTAAQF
ncbi:hypothetical protein MANY_18350 [Mycolicibacterium anyangense]|uniref:DUF8174 domain-containing protein n=1 Tax=Mycolicibacterium anyangense TaxID=1431246 RepID=A0A6N4W7K1_9MYCO|nr:hypothetical protein [Mycolicibacterium anyangense]BBZ76498.1 hypothetical protein MANY_18350 [Mycolicibacterium anyangense]